VHAVAARRRVRVVAVALCSGAALTAIPKQAHATKSKLPPQVGYNYQNIETPRVAAMGDALRAFSNSVSALFVNPANMAASRVYHLSAFGQIWPEAHRQSYGAAAVDSIVSSAHVAGGLGGTWTSQDPDGLGLTSTDLRFALAFPFSDRFYVGLGGRYLWLKQTGSAGPFDPSPASGGIRDKNIVRGFTFDAGATLKPMDGLALSIVGQNLNNPGNGFQPMSFGGGIGFGTHDSRSKATRWPTSRPGIAPPCAPWAASSSWLLTTIRSAPATATTRDRRATGSARASATSTRSSPRRSRCVAPSSARRPRPS